MKKWTNEKLEKECYFAACADDKGTACAVWNAKLVAECKRRGQVPPINLMPNWQGTFIPDNVQ